MIKYNYFIDNFSNWRWKINTELVEDIKRLCAKDNISLHQSSYKETVGRWHYVIRSIDDIKKYWVCVNL